MADLQKAVEAQLNNLQLRSGKTMTALLDLLRESGLTRHGELRDYAKRELGMGHGDANALAHHFLARGTPPPASDQVGEAAVLDAIYTGPKAALRPVHEALMHAARELGDFELAPKKGYVSLRRRKQFAMIGPATRTQVELGLNVRGLAATPRLSEIPPGGMCNVKTRLEAVDEVDAELVGWLRQAYDGAA